MRWVWLCVSLVSCVSLFATNVILISLDGTSQETFYQLLRKDKLPNISRVVEQGNTRTFFGDGTRSYYYSSYRQLFSGFSDKDLGTVGTDPIPNGQSIFEVLDDHVDTISSGYLISKPIDIRAQEVPSLSVVLSDVNMTLTALNPEIHRSSKTIGEETVQQLQSLESPYFFALNFTNVAYMAQRYREGAELYSLAIKNCDRAVGMILDYLDETDEDTEVIILSPFGYKPTSRKLSENAWIASTRKVYRKGNLLDIVPSILSLYDVDPSVLDHYAGKTLFYLD